MEKIRKLFIPVIVAILAIAGSVSYISKGNVKIEQINPTNQSDSFGPLGLGTTPELGNAASMPGDETSKSSDMTSMPCDETLESGDATSTELNAVTKVDLNTATEEELQIAPGIGPAKAKAIIKYRETYGKFSSVDELIEISGIGEKTLAKIRDYYMVK